jgi:hypothetical protein
MAEKWNPEDDQAAPGAVDDQIRGVGDEDEVDETDADDLDDEEDEEEGSTF